MTMLDGFSEPEPGNTEAHGRQSEPQDQEGPHDSEQEENEEESRDPVLPEWHVLTAEQRETAWRELLEWVVWLHDRYELGIEERLPHCWPLHPGLIEELRALKVWRQEIYTSTKPIGQAARYWHAELRQTIHAAQSFYAAGCRAGHRSDTNPVVDDTERRQRWASADPAAGIPDKLLVADDGEPLSDGREYLTAETMHALLENGGAVQLGETVTEILRHDESWWMPRGGGWIRVTEAGLDRDCTERAERMARADTSVKRRATAKTQAPNQPGGQSASARTDEESS